MVLGKFCFEEEAFSGEGFEVGAFLEDCRARSPMETIHQDLKQFQTALENQLVAIINEDYAEFLQLSSKLKGVDEAVSSVRAPILAVLKRVDEAQHAMTALRGKTHAQLQTADELQQQEKDLQLSIQISEKLLLLEELLEIESPADSDEDEQETGAGGSCPVDSDEDSDDEFDNFERVKKSLNATSAAEGCAKLERAAQIFVQLDLEFLNGMHLGTIQREEKRLAVVEETLLRRLETEFATEIFPDTFYNRDHAISSLTLSYLLRADFHVLYEKISQDLLPAIKSRVDDLTNDSLAFVTELFQEPLAALAELEASCWSTAVTLVAADCKKVLPAIRTVKGQYQMTNKPPPTTPSTYVPNIIRPMQDFLEKWGVHFDTTKRHQLLLAIVEEVCDVYSTLSSELLRSALELEESLKSRKLQRHSGSSSTLANNSVSDTEKMRMQLLLDLEEIQREAAALGLDVQHCSGLQAAIAKLSDSES
ncbi:putative conserved oligomeric Golgi complex subunit [Phytophthora cinnamomi]|uniref:putative conserved oligomeric Golgi complex subunit n=1 Tax=Phytophthora cinnamomi TaxID=4785 RepID=UPI00355A43F1|nr:putative conserved oligomeric Golgi complex subunit [Phytophthora cinnamomi]